MRRTSKTIFIIFLQLFLISFSQVYDEKTLFENWKQYTKPLTISESIVTIWDYGHNDYSAFSEAMGHALIFSVYFNDQTYFNSILNGLEKYFKKDNGLYRWMLSSDGFPPPDTEQHKSASETELNVLVALLKASKKWPNQDIQIWDTQLNGYTTNNYNRIADRLEENMWNNFVYTIDKYSIFLPAEKNYKDWPILNKQPKKIALALTYYNMAYLKFIASNYPNHNWKKVIDDGYILLNQILKDYTSYLFSDEPTTVNAPLPAWIIIEETSNGSTLVNYFKNTQDSWLVKNNEFDSYRIPFYVGMDGKDHRALNLFKRYLSITNVTKPEDAFVGAGNNPQDLRGWNSLDAIASQGLVLKTLNDPRYNSFKERLSLNSKDMQTYFFSSSPIAKDISKKYYYNKTFVIYGYLMFNNKL